MIRRATVWGLLVFVLAAGLLLPVSWHQYRRNENDLEAATRIQAVETAIRLQQEINHHLKLLELLRDNLRNSGDFSRERFVAEASLLNDSWPAFQAVNWIDPQGVIRTVVPRDGNEPALGLNVLDVPLAAPAFRRALAGTALVATPPLDLRQGGRGVTSYLAVRADGEVQGVINGVFRLDQLFDILLGAGLLERYAIRVTDQEVPVFVAGTVPERFLDRPRVSVIFDQRSWQVLLAPRAEQAPDFAAQFRQEVFGILGLALLAALLTVLLSYKQLSLRRSEQRFRELNRLLPDMVFECDAAWRITYLNRLAQRQLGYGDADLGNLSLGELIGVDDLPHFFSELRDELVTTPSVTRICTVYRQDGDTISCEVTLGAIRDAIAEPVERAGETADDAEGRFLGLRGVLRDITERLDAERTMNQLANFDSTTELPNRAMFLEVLDHELRQAAAQNRQLVLMVVDLDNFKHINDRLGPSMGDLLLREAGQRLRDALNRQEYVFRLSGDEFAVLFDSLQSGEDIERMAQLLLDTLRQPYRLRPNSEEIIDATIGVSRFPEDAATMEQMYMHADSAVHEAKTEGGRRYRLFTQEISRQMNERQQLEESLRHAVHRGELRLFYQPVVNAAEGTLIGMEALLRWQHPVRGLLTPYHFIHVAEETGLIDEIGSWVLHEACRQLAAWDAQGVAVPQIGVNASAHQLESGVLGADVRHALRENGLNGERLVLELTESLLMRDVHFAARTLHELKRLGVRAAVDDFGTGYSSLAYLNRLPLDTLKIDRAFVVPIVASPVHAASSAASAQILAEHSGDTRITEAVIALGRSLKLRIVAEGVEHEQQARFLLRHGCAVMQGYFFSRPVPAADVPALLDQDWRVTEESRRATA